MFQGVFPRCEFRDLFQNTCPRMWGLRAIHGCTSQARVPWAVWGCPSQLVRPLMLSGIVCKYMRFLICILKHVTGCGVYYLFQCAYPGSEFSELFVGMCLRVGASNVLACMCPRIWAFSFPCGCGPQGVKHLYYSECISQDMRCLMCCGFSSQGLGSLSHFWVYFSDEVWSICVSISHYASGLLGGCLFVC